MQNPVLLNERSIQPNFKKFMLKKYSINHNKNRSYKLSENKIYVKYIHFSSIIHPSKLRYEKTTATFALASSSGKTPVSSKNYSSLFKDPKIFEMFMKQPYAVGTLFIILSMQFAILTELIIEIFEKMKNGNQESSLNFSLIKKEDLEEFEVFIKNLKSIKIVSVRTSPAFEEWLDIVYKNIYSDIERDWLVLRDFLGYKKEKPSSSSSLKEKKTALQSSNNYAIERDDVVKKDIGAFTISFVPPENTTTSSSQSLDEIETEFQEPVSNITTISNSYGISSLKPKEEEIDSNSDIKQDKEEEIDSNSDIKQDNIKKEEDNININNIKEDNIKEEEEVLGVDNKVEEIIDENELISRIIREKEEYVKKNEEKDDTTVESVIEEAKKVRREIASDLRKEKESSYGKIVEENAVLFKFDVDTKESDIRSIIEEKKRRIFKDKTKAPIDDNISQIRKEDIEEKVPEVIPIVIEKEEEEEEENKMNGGEEKIPRMPVDWIEKINSTYSKVENQAEYPDNSKADDSSVEVEVMPEQDTNENVTNDDTTSASIESPSIKNKYEKKTTAKASTSKGYSGAYERVPVRKNYGSGKAPKLVGSNGEGGDNYGGSGGSGGGGGGSGKGGSGGSGSDDEHMFSKNFGFSLFTKIVLFLIFVYIWRKITYKQKSTTTTTT